LSERLVNSNQCVECLKTYRESHREERKAAAAARYAIHGDADKAAKKAKRAADPEGTRAAQRSYAGSNRERLRAHDRRHYRDNKEKRLAAAKLWRATHKDWSQAYNARYRSENIETTRPVAKKWRQENRATINAIESKRRARLMGAEGSHTAAEVEAIYQRQKCRCAECRVRMIKKQGTSISRAKDHIIPLAKSGTDYAWNIQWLCRTCNSQKRDKDIIEWAKVKGRLL
jgi:hypothetical protein